jgi:hypothetical protein
MEGLEDHLRVWGILPGETKSDHKAQAIYVNSIISRDFSGKNDEVASKILAPLAGRSNRRADLSILRSRTSPSFGADLSTFATRDERKADLSVLISNTEARLPFDEMETEAGPAIESERGCGTPATQGIFGGFI